MLNHAPHVSFQNLIMDSTDRRRVAVFFRREKRKLVAGLFAVTLMSRFVSVTTLSAPIQLLSTGPAPPEELNASVRAGATSQMSEAYGRVPLMFEPANTSDNEFLCRGLGYQLFLSPTEATLALTSRKANPRIEKGELADTTFLRSAAKSTVVRVRFCNANTTAKADGLEQLPTKVNYLLGNNPEQWRTQVPAFGKVRYQNVYPGIDLVYYGNQRQMEYDFVVAPGASIEPIELCFQGVTKTDIDASGDLVLQTADGQIRQHKPVVYQEINGVRREVAGHYVRRSADARTVGFEIPAYDNARPLIIDPVLVYSTYLGGLGFERAWDIAVDAGGNAYVVGETSSTNFPPNNAQFSTNSGGPGDVFVAKLSAGGTNLIFSTYLGGNDDDAAFGVALDANGNVYVAGLTSSTNFPVTTNAVSTNLHGVPFFGHYPYDAFVAKLDADGASLLYSTYLGGSAADVASGITVDDNGNVYVVGETVSTDFPTNAASPPFGGAHDAFVVKFTATDTNLIYSVYLGGSGDDRGQSIAVDSSGNAVVVGLTASTNFPTANAIQTNFAGGTYDVFVTKLSSDGATKLFSTYLGGDGDDEAFRVTLDGADNAYLTGFTTSTNFPTANALYPTNNGSSDAFIVKLDPVGTNLIYSTYLGGALNEAGWSLALDGNTNLYVVGFTSSTNFPVTNAFQSALAGFDDVFVVKLNTGGTALEYSTYFGGLLTDHGLGIAVDPAGNAYITGTTASGDFPVYPSTNGLQTAFGGGTGDAFVSKLFPRNSELRAQLSSSNRVTISWPNGLPDFDLQATDNLAGTNINWTTVTNPPIVVGDDNTLTFTNATDNLFFRLKRTQ